MVSNALVVFFQSCSCFCVLFVWLLLRLGSMFRRGAPPEAGCCLGQELCRVLTTHTTTHTTPQGSFATKTKSCLSTLACPLSYVSDQSGSFPTVDQDAAASTPAGPEATYLLTLSFPPPLIPRAHTGISGQTLCLLPPSTAVVTPLPQSSSSRRRTMQKQEEDDLELSPGALAALAEFAVQVHV